MTDQKLRILLLADSRSFHIERLVAQLRRQDCHVLTASLERGAVHHFHLKPRLPIRPLSYFLVSQQIKAIARRYSPDIIYAHFATGYGYAAARSVKSLKIPMILNIWGSDILMADRPMTFRRHKARLALKRADHVFADSEYLLTAARRLFDNPNGDVIPWGIEQELLTLHKKDYSFQTPLKIIVPRAHEPVYGNLFIVKALAGLVNSGKIQITFPEFGSQAESFRRQAQSMVGERIQYYRKLSRREFIELMASHDVYLSNSQSDSSPVSLIEAMALGLVPVAADIPGVREWLKAESGLSYPVGNAGALVTTITDLVEGDDCFEKMREGNLTRVKQEALFENNVERQVKIMRFIAEEARS